jgi:hypothetical protein
MAIFFSLLRPPATSCGLLLLSEGRPLKPTESSQELWSTGLFTFVSLLHTQRDYQEKSSNINVMRFFGRLGKHQGRSWGSKPALNYPVKSMAYGRLTAVGGCRFFLVGTMV